MNLILFRYGKRTNTGTTQPTLSKPTPIVSENIPQETQKSNGGVYNANGLRLDRTPTDEEINWLWEKVRNCLSKDQSVPPEDDLPTTKPSIYLANKYIDGQNMPVANRSIKVIVTK